MRKTNLLSIFGVLTFLILLTLGVVFYARGWRVDINEGTITTTGVILATSNPEGAKVFLNDKLAGVTDTSIAGLVPGTYKVKIEKEGYSPWEKEVPVEEELVTEVNALLPQVSPSLTSITHGGAKKLTPAPSGSKAAFISQDALFILPLTNQFLGFLRTRPQKIAEAPEDVSFTKVQKIVFSPNEDQALVVTQGGAALFTLGQNTAQVASNPNNLQERWEDTKREHKAETIKTLEVPENLKDVALANDTVWAPDERKFLYTKQNGKTKEFWVANLTDPLPVGEKVNQKILRTKDSNLKLFWAGDSAHFVMLNGNTVSVLDVDGSNKRDIYSGSLAEKVAFSSPDLAQVIVLTSLSPNSGANLYAISLH